MATSMRGEKDQKGNKGGETGPGRRDLLWVEKKKSVRGEVLRALSKVGENAFDRRKGEGLWLWSLLSSTEMVMGGKG